MKTYTFHVSGTHCASCKILIEDILNDEKDVQKAIVHLKQQTVEVETSSEITPQEIVSALSEKIKANGYSLSLEKNQESRATPDILWQALPIGLVFLALFVLLQKSGLFNIGLGSSVTPVISFIIGLVASLSSCLAVVGGLVLSLSATVSLDDEDDRKPILLFHVGRIVTFAILGGMLGYAGQLIGISSTVSALLGLFASLVMILLGLNLLGVLKKTHIALPTGLFSYFRKIEHQTLAPLVVGAGTFFLPCGFTQSMQIAALSSGSFISGLTIMLAFSLGTLPMLALLSFGAASFAHSKHAPLFFASAGVVVIGLGTLAFLAGLAGLGVINPLFNI